MKSLLLIALSLIYFTESFAQTPPSYLYYPPIMQVPPSTAHRFTTSNGRIDIGPQNGSAAHIYTDRPVFFFNKDVRSIGGFFGSYQNNLRLGPDNTTIITVLNTNGNTGLRTANPTHDLQIHGIHDYIVSGGSTSSSGSGSEFESSNEGELNGGNDLEGGSPFDEGTMSGGTNYGKAACIGLTNSSLSGSGMYSGGLIMQAGTNLHVWNRENGNLNLRASGLNVRLSGANNRMLVGSGLNLGLAQYALTTIHAPSDNGLYIQTNNSSRYGLSVKVAQNSSIAFRAFGSSSSTPNFTLTGGGVLTTVQLNAQATNDQNIAFQCFGSNNQQPNFMVYGSGIVKARKIIVDLDTWADYVFSDDYELMPLYKVKEYITKFGHLPNVPSAKEIENKGVDLAETAKITMEKVEELTLYVIQQQELLEKQQELLELQQKQIEELKKINANITK